MQRNEIHIQITEVAEKIATLNRHLSQSSKIMKAETDLMNVYLNEMKILLNELTKTIQPLSAQPVEIKKEVTFDEQKNIPAVDAKKMKKEVEVEKKPEPVIPKTEPVKPEEKQAVVSKSLNEMFSKKTVDLAEKLQGSSSGKHLKDIISLSDKFMFVNELFKSDKQYFEDAVKKINELQSLDEAIHFIESELKTNFNWDKKQNVVEQFQQAVKKKFGNNN